MKIYQEGMFCKHFKGKDLLEKNIYRIVKLGVEGKDINEEDITYSGDGILSEAHDLVIYASIFQNNKLFAREYSDISSSLSEEKSLEFGQIIKVQPLTSEEVMIINDPSFVEVKLKAVAEKFNKSL